MPWQTTAEHQRALLDEAIVRSREKLPRFAVFSFTPIPLAIHLGYLLSDRVEAIPFQYDRDRHTWSWDPQVTNPDAAFEVHGLPEIPIIRPIEVAIRVSLSARITPEETAAIAGRLPVEVDFEVNEPSVTWLNHPDQLTLFGKTFRDLLNRIRVAVPNATRFHLFYAGPTGCAIVAGQAINPQMNPPIQLYEYNRKSSPRYEPVLLLE